jgi:hypothetical protein
MGNIQSFKQIHFEEIQNAIETNQIQHKILINTLSDTNQQCLIYGTTNASNEVDIINQLLKKDKTRHIIIYGKNYGDHTIYKKYNQLKGLGFRNISLYSGGMFEWLCLQEIFGVELFKTIGMEVDILKYSY